MSSWLAAAAAAAEAAEAAAPPTGAGSPSLAPAGAGVVAVLGDAFADVFCPLAAGAELPAWGGDALLRGVSVKAGGSAGNTAAQLGALCAGRAESGWQVEFHTALGRDAWAEVVAAQHARARVRLVAAQKNASATGVCVVVSGRQDRAFLTSHGAMDAFCEGDLDVARLQQARHLHIGGFFSVPALQPALAGLVRRLRAGSPRLTVSLDTNYDASGQWGGAALLELLREVDMFKPNEAEAAGLAARLLGGAAPRDDAEALLALSRAVRPGGVVVLTQGERGALFRENLDSAPLHHVRAPVVPFKDATGAGDAFSAAFIFKRSVLGAPLRDAVEYGVRAGSFAVQHDGACDVLLSEQQLDCAALSPPPN